MFSPLIDHKIAVRRRGRCYHCLSQDSAPRGTSVFGDRMNVIFISQKKMLKLENKPCYFFFKVGEWHACLVVIYR